MIENNSQNEKEFSRLLEIYKEKKPKSVLEIGTHLGGSLYQWITNATPGTVVSSIDNQHVNKGSYESWCPSGVSIRYFNGLSQSKEAIEFAKEYAPIDFLFIDGGHSYEEVEDDFRNYLPLMNERGIIAFHDIYNKNAYVGDDGVVYPTEVYFLWNSLTNVFDTREIIEDHDEWGRGPGIGVIYL